MDLSAKNAVITGAAIRLGRSITLALAEAGCNVFIHYGKSDDAAAETASAAERFGVRAIAHTADLADADQTTGIMHAASKAMGHVDILINSASIFLGGGLMDTDLKKWSRQCKINMRAPFLLSQAFVKQFPDGCLGHILNILDGRIFRPGPDHFAYRITKAGVLAMTENLASELAPRIAVNAIAPGAILAPPGEDKSYLERIANSRIPMRKAGSPEDIAQAVLYLLRQDFVTGQTLRVDGGEFL